MRKIIFGVLAMAGIALGVCELYGWPWSVIVVGAMMWGDLILAEIKT